MRITANPLSGLPLLWPRQTVLVQSTVSSVAWGFAAMQQIADWLEKLGRPSTRDALLKIAALAGSVAGTMCDLGVTRRSLIFLIWREQFRLHPVCYVFLNLDERIETENLRPSVAASDYLDTAGSELGRSKRHPGSA